MRSCEFLEKAESSDYDEFEIPYSTVTIYLWNWKKYIHGGMQRPGGQRRPVPPIFVQYGNYTLEQSWLLSNIHCNVYG